MSWTTLSNEDKGYFKHDFVKQQEADREKRDATFVAGYEPEQPVKDIK